MPKRAARCLVAAYERGSARHGAGKGRAGPFVLRNGAMAAMCRAISGVFGAMLGAIRRDQHFRRFQLSTMLRLLIAGRPEALIFSDTYAGSYRLAG